MQNSIRTRLAITFVALAASLLLVVGAVLAWQSYAKDREQAIILQNELATRISNQVVSYMREQESALLELVKVRGFSGLDHDQQTQLLSELLSFTDAFDSLALLSSNGRETIVVSRTQIISQLGDRSTTDEFIIPQSSGQIYYSPVQFSENTGEPFLYIAIPIENIRTGVIENVLLAEVRFKPVWDLLASISLGEGSNAYIVDANNKVVAHNNPSVVLRNTLFTVPSQDGIHDGVSGNRVILAISKISLGAQDLKIVAETPTSEAFAGIVKTELTITALLLIAVAIAIGLGWFAARQIVEPIEDLTATAEIIANGDLSKKANIRRMDEIGKLGRIFNQMTEQLQSVLTGLEQRVAERTQELENRAAQLQAIADVARSISTIQDIDQLLPDITKLVSERFGYYHVGIFLLDENGDYAILRAANSEGGQKMLVRHHRLQVGQQGIVGYVTAGGRARIALDVGEEAVFFSNPDLPDTHSEVALPLIVSGTIIGALDIQSTEVGAFSQESIASLAILADQVAIAIQNARSLNLARRALQEADIASRRLTGQAWRAFGQSMTIKGIHYDGSRSEIIGEVGYQSVKGALKVPIKLRELEIASLIIAPINPNHQWLNDEILIAQAIAERTALALENARLIEDAQRRAAKESLISEISTKIVEATDTNKIMAATVSELQRVLGASEVSFRLSVDEPST